MGAVSAAVLFAVVWSMTFFIALPFRVKTQGDLNEIVPGTHAGAPEHHHLKKKAFWTTIASILIWGFLVLVITSGKITVDDLENWIGRGAPEATSGTGE